MSAVHVIRVGVRKSPAGTAKNRKPSGKAKARASCQPSTAGTLSTSRATSANWVAVFTATSSPISHRKLASATSSKGPSAGLGWIASTCSRRRQTNHSAIGGTTQAWAKVSELSHTAVMASKVPRCIQSRPAHTSTKVIKARCQPGLDISLFIAGFNPGCGPRTARASWRTRGVADATHRSATDTWHCWDCSGARCHACKGSTHIAGASARSPSSS